MFAIPFTASVSTGIGQQVWGRLWSRSKPSESGLATAPAASQDMTSEMEEDAIPDLAQRVREVGEW